jgi:hypothetical protein
VITVSKDILAEAAGGEVSISEVDNRFDQNNVPEPVTCGLVGLGLIALAGTRRFLHR